MSNRLRANDGIVLIGLNLAPDNGNTMLRQSPNIIQRPLLLPNIRDIVPPPLPHNLRKRRTVRLPDNRKLAPLESDPPDRTTYQENQTSLASRTTNQRANLHTNPLCSIRRSKVLMCQVPRHIEV